MLSTARAMTALPEPEALPAHPTPPDALVTFGGKPVTNAHDWMQRAAELSQLVQVFEYGAMPSPSKFTVKVVREDKAALGCKATLRELTLVLEKPAGTQINLLVVVPNKRTAPSPAFLGLNFNGNFALLPDPLISVPPNWKSRTYPAADKARGA
jgi:hypothetical protein